MFTRNTPITPELLTKMKACNGATTFLKAFKLEGYCLNDLEITGDYRSHIYWLENRVAYPYVFKCLDITITDTSDKRIDELKASDKYWYERTRDVNGKLLTHVTSNGYTETWTYDDKCNVLTRVNSKGLTQTYTYDSNSNLLTHVNSNGVTVTWTYDSNGNILTSVDNIGYTETFTYDDKGNELTCIGSNGASLTTTYTYDSNNNLLTYVCSNGYTYDTSNLPKGILCQVFKDKEIILSISKK